MSKFGVLGDVDKLLSQVRTDVQHVAATLNNPAGLACPGSKREI